MRARSTCTGDARLRVVWRVVVRCRPANEPATDAQRDRAVQRSHDEAASPARRVRPYHAPATPPRFGCAPFVERLALSLQPFRLVASARGSSQYRLSMRSLGFPLVLVAAIAACSGNGSLRPPTSDSQADDPCDPGGSGSQAGPAPAVDAGAAPLAVPGGTAGIGFDDLRFSGTLSRILVPAGRTGDLDLLDPSSEIIASVGGFSTSDTFSGDDTFGVTSADEGNAIVYAVDRTSKTLAAVDPKSKSIASTVALATTPGYVRFVAPTNEVWVTEPSAGQIEVFTVTTSASTAPVHASVIAIPGGGPESLEIDAAAAMAYTNTTTQTVQIDVNKHAISATWSNGCSTSKGLAIDSTNQWVMPACEEGRIVVLAAQGGATIGTVTVGGGVDQVAYDAQRQRLYVPGPAAAAMSVVGFASNGVPKVLGSIQTTNDAHCAVSAGLGSVYVCAPSRGELLFVQDPF
ncbi:MAG TPA: hypothetical protein VGG39_33870 [Polyangiaceae bacterium]|jgi:hypothetical protein